ncbi:PspC domain-containing protein [Isobaculum melis]|uniref:Phage shock protein PspC (Stress-responsive transcriptional regulator) n=1 Tax=Isobaculum melis TaxID=142588 RepID=A0A1H9QKL3_9LACT|nr:Phage shock protein PspC (stress-responsive transcriptional regulator) [Isobaculum melis]
MRRLTKSNDRVLDGVLGGIAEYIGIDPTLVRVIFVLLSFFTVAFPGIFVYIVLAIVMPSASRDGRRDRRENRRRERRYYSGPRYTSRESSAYKGEHPYADNHSYQDYRKNQTTRKEAEKIDEDDWSDF